MQQFMSLSLLIMVHDSSLAHIDPNIFKVTLPVHNHTKPMVEPHIEQQLKDAKTCTLASFEVAVFGSPLAEKATKWVDEITAQKWFSDVVIQEHLEKYCTASEELLRYQPFVDLCNLLIERAPGRLSGVPHDSSYPISRITFLINAFSSPKGGQTTVNRPARLQSRWQQFGISFRSEDVRSVMHHLCTLTISARWL